MKNAKVDASLYLLTGLLQRLERDKPGLIEEMRNSVKQDRQQVPSDIPEYEHVSEIFDEAELLLNRTQMLSNN